MGTPSPLQNASATAFGAAAYAPAFGSAGMGPSAPTIYANSSGPLSPQHSQVPRRAAAQPCVSCIALYAEDCLVFLLRGMPRFHAVAYPAFGLQQFC